MAGDTHPPEMNSITTAYINPLPQNHQSGKSGEQIQRIERTGPLLSAAERNAALEQMRRRYGKKAARVYAGF